MYIVSLDLINRFHVQYVKMIINCPLMKAWFLGKVHSHEPVGRILFTCGRLVFTRSSLFLNFGLSWVFLFFNRLALLLLANFSELSCFFFLFRWFWYKFFYGLSLRLFHLFYRLSFWKFSFVYLFGFLVELLYGLRLLIVGECGVVEFLFDVFG